jgi:thiopeptide-type bacteriocin biosynthesis protein
MRRADLGMGLMPAAHLTPSASQVADAVLAILTGRDPADVATAAGLPLDDLADAAQAYHAAGIIALEQREIARWHQVRVSPSRQQPPELALATVVGPRLDGLTASGAPGGWWYMNKPPGWRIRLRNTQPALAGEIFDDLAAAGVITAWTPAFYEPETAAFGGPAGMDIAHDLFCADTTGTLAYIWCNDPPLGRREISVLLISAMLSAAGLDWHECGDVFARVAAMRPEPQPGTAGQAAQLTGQLRTLLAIPAAAFFSEDGTAAARWHTGFTDAGRRLADASSCGTLSRGLRAILAHHVIFHWNRLGLPAAAQAILARAAASACLPGTG